MDNTNTVLFIIDPQQDFSNPKIGSLYVNGANEDMIRLAKFIKNNKNKLSRIIVTMDTHRKLAIFHPMFWINKDGQRPQPFTAVTLEDVESGVWRAANDSLQEIAIKYLNNLKENNRYYPLVVWPEHCKIGTVGWTVHEDLMEALSQWEDDEFIVVDYIVKGTNLFTEMYSAIRADVVDEMDESTKTNFDLIWDLDDYDHIIVAGEALSHCVANTIKDLAEHINPEKITLLTDATSNVAGFESMGENFIKEMQQKGMKLSTTTEINI